LPIPKPCLQRHHNYGTDGVCAGCGKKRGTREPRAGGAGLRAALGINDVQPKREDPPATDAGEGDAGGRPAPVASPQPAPAAAPDKPKRGARFWQRVAEKLWWVFDTGTDALIERTGRVPNAPQEETVTEFQEELATKLATWFPDREMGPGAACIVAGGFIIAEKAWNAEKIAPPPPKAPTATTTPPPEPRPTPTEETPPNGHSAAPAAATEAEVALLQSL
jgi:hypothetical protein